MKIKICISSFKMQCGSFLQTAEHVIKLFSHMDTVTLAGEDYPVEGVSHYSDRLLAGGQFEPVDQLLGNRSIFVDAKHYVLGKFAIVIFPESRCTVLIR